MPNWITKLRDRFFGLFSSKTKDDNSEAIPEKTPELEISRQPGLSCPECGTKLVISMETLLNYEPVQCFNCGLELTIDQEKSKQSIESLRKLNQGLSEAKKVRADGQL